MAQSGIVSKTFITVQGEKITSNMPLDDFKTEDGEKREFRGNQHTNEQMSKGEIIKRLQELSDELGETPTMRQAIEDDRLPSAGTIDSVFDSWNELLREANLDVNHKYEYSEDDKKDMIKDIKRCYKQVEGYLTVRQYIEIGEYSHTTIKKYFGSWSEALEEAGVKSGSRHGNQTVCHCGEILDSVNEKVVGDILHELNIEHNIHKGIPKSDFLTDFYLPEADLWIEVDGYKNIERPNQRKYEEKKEHYKKEGLDFIEIKVPYTLVKDEVKNKIIKNI